MDLGVRDVDRPRISVFHRLVTRRIAIPDPTEVETIEVDPVTGPGPLDPRVVRVDAAPIKGFLIYGSKNIPELTAARQLETRGNGVAVEVRGLEHLRRRPQWCLRRLTLRERPPAPGDQCGERREYQTFHFSLPSPPTP